MNITGLIVEYNPFHNGHIYHINKAKELTDADLVVACMSGNFTQRGEPSIIDKFTKTEAALLNGVDLVVELPYIHTVQNASVFGEKSVRILERLKVNNIVFGSETNNLEDLTSFADHNIIIDHLKEEMDKGTSFPKAYGLLAGSLYPNDILAVSYLKAVKGTDIKPFSIQRTSNYHSEELTEMASAKAIRTAYKNGEDISKHTPVKIEDPVYMEDMYPYLQRLLMTASSKELSEIFLVSEGIENLFKKNAEAYDTFEEFLSHSISKRYTGARISRISLNIMNHIRKDDVERLADLPYVRVLGFNKKGQEYLRTLKKDDVEIATQFKKLPDSYKEIEWKASCLYASYLKDRKGYLKKELKGPIVTD